MFSYFPFGFEGRVWDLIVSVPDHCISFTLKYSYNWHIEHFGPVQVWNRLLNSLECSSNLISLERLFQTPDLHMKLDSHCILSLRLYCNCSRFDYKYAKQLDNNENYFL